MAQPVVVDLDDELFSQRANETVNAGDGTLATPAGSLDSLTVAASAGLSYTPSGRRLPHWRLSISDFERYRWAPNEGTKGLPKNTRRFYKTQNVIIDSFHVADKVRSNFYFFF
jgi:hypothetical protein